MSIAILYPVIILLLGSILVVFITSRFRSYNLTSQIFQQNPCFALVIDHRFRVIKINNVGSKLVEFTTDELKEKSVDILFNQPEIAHFRMMVSQCMKERKSDVFVGQLRTKKGNEISLNFTVMPIITGKQVKKVLIVGRDLSDVVQFERRIHDIQLELQDTIRQQQGMILKYVKKGNEFIHTLCDGELLYRMGLQPSDVVGKSLHEILPQSDADEKLKSYRLAWQGESTEYEGVINGVDYVSALRPVIRNNQVIEVIGSCIDISDRKRAEKELREKRNLYRTVLRTMSEALFIIDSNGFIRNMNQNAMNILGIQPELIHGNKLCQLKMQMVKQNGTPISNHNLQNLLIKKTRIIFDDLVLGIKLDEEKVKWLSINSRPLQLDEEQPSVLVSFKDITLQKTQELKIKETFETQKTIINNLNIGLFLTDQNRKFTIFNNKFSEMFNIDNLDSYVGKNGEDLHHLFFENLADLNKRVESIIKRKEPLKDEVRLKNGRYYIRRFIPISIENDYKGNLWTLEDITRQKEMNVALIRAKDEAERTNLAKSDFLSKMSHESAVAIKWNFRFCSIAEIGAIINE